MIYLKKVLTNYKNKTFLLICYYILNKGVSFKSWSHFWQY